MLELAWEGDKSGLLRNAQRGRALDDEYCVLIGIELVTSMGRSKMV